MYLKQTDVYSKDFAKLRGWQTRFFHIQTQFLRICNKKSGDLRFFSQMPQVRIESRSHPTHQNASQVRARKNTRLSRDFPTVSIHVKVPTTYFDDGGSEFLQISTWFCELGCLIRTDVKQQLMAT